MQLDQTRRLKRLFAWHKRFVHDYHRHVIIALSSIVVIYILASVVVQMGSSAQSRSLSTTATSPVTPTQAATQPTQSNPGTTSPGMKSSAFTITTDRHLNNNDASIPGGNKTPTPIQNQQNQIPSPTANPISTSPS